MGKMMIPDHGTRKRKQAEVELGFRRRKVAKRNPPAFTVVKKYQLGLGTASSDSSSSSTDSYCSTATSRPPPPISDEAEEEVQQEIKKINSFRPKSKEEDEEVSGDDADEDTQNWLLLHYIRSDSTITQHKLLKFKPILMPRWMFTAVIFVEFIFIPIGFFSFIDSKWWKLFPVTFQVVFLRILARKTLKS